MALGNDQDGCRILEAANPIAGAFVPVIGVLSRSLLAEAAIRRGDLVQAARWQDEILATPACEKVTVATRTRA